MHVGCHNSCITVISHCSGDILNFVTSPNTVVTVGFQMNAYTAAEAFGVVVICAALTGQTQRDVPVNISISNIAGTADGKHL